MYPSSPLLNIVTSRKWLMLSFFNFLSFIFVIIFIFIFFYFYGYLTSKLIRYNGCTICHQGDKTRCSDNTYCTIIVVSHGVVFYQGLELCSPFGQMKMQKGHLKGNGHENLDWKKSRALYILYAGITTIIYRAAADLLHGRFAAENVHFAVAFFFFFFYTPLLFGCCCFCFTVCVVFLFVDCFLPNTGHSSTKNR